jgi:DNA-directed RNA polymerase specialized sigma24 family protein
LCITAVRMLTDLVRVREKEIPFADEILNRLSAFQIEPELNLIRLQHGAALKGALAEVLVRWSPADQALLRYQLEGLDHQRIADLLGVHRTSALRRLQRLHEILRRDLKEALCRMQGIHEDEVDSILFALRSRVLSALHSLPVALETAPQQD